MSSAAHLFRQMCQIKYEVKRQGVYDIMNGLGKWARSVVRRTIRRSARLKARKKKPSSKGKSLLSKKGNISSSGESAVVHFVQSSLHSFGDEIKMSDNDPAVGRTVENLSVVGSDTLTTTQE